MKKCPYCAETDLQDEAKICKHCGKDVTQPDQPASSKELGSPWIPLFGICFVIAGFFFWPLWILAVLLFILNAINQKK